VSDLSPSDILGLLPAEKPAEEMEAYGEKHGVKRLARYHRLNFTPALKLAVRGWHELLESDLAENVVILAWDQKAIVAFDGDKAVGVIVWIINAERSECFIVLSYVLPEHRRGGWHSAMFEELERIARDLKLHHIRSGMISENQTMKSVCDSEGRKVVALVTQKDL
jgi:GNAT superfamily N-acetyltransferase